MRARRFSYTLAALDADGYLNDITSTGSPWTTFLAQPGDGLAHPVTIASTSDLRAITFTLTGTDAEGHTITETITGPNNTTVTSTKYYATLTSVTSSATLGAATADVGWTAVGVTPAFICDRYPHGGASLQVNLGGTTCNFTPQQMVQDPWNTTVQTNAAKLVNDVWVLMAAAGTADSVNMSSDGATAVRVLVNSHTSGVLTLGISQPMR